MRSPVDPGPCDASVSVAARLKLEGSAFGVGFAVQADTPGLLEEARLRVPPTWRPSRAGRPRREYVLAHAADGVRVETDGTTLAQRLSHSGALDVLESDLQLFVAQHSPAFVFIHAGVVGVGERALVFPGASGAGKTTLVRALLKAGATYYSDEYALLDTRGRVHPYARALSIRLKDGAKQRVPVGRSLAPTGGKPLALGVVLLTEFSKGGRWHPVPLSKGELVLSLLANAVAVRDRPAQVMATLARAVTGAEGYRSPRGDASRMARAVLRLAAGRLGGAKLTAHVHGARLRPAAPSPRPRLSRSRR